MARSAVLSSPNVAASCAAPLDPPVDAAMIANSEDEASVIGRADDCRRRALLAELVVADAMDELFTVSDKNIVYESIVPAAAAALSTARLAADCARADAYGSGSTGQRDWVADASEMSVFAKEDALNSAMRPPGVRNTLTVTSGSETPGPPRHVAALRSNARAVSALMKGSKLSDKPL